MIVLFNQDGVT